MSEEENYGLEETASCLGDQYDKWKAAEKKKDQFKKRFFKLATEAVNEQPLAERVITVTAPDEETAITRAKQQNPTWATADEARQISAGSDTWEVLAVEDPAYKPFTFSQGGRDFKRQVNTGSPVLDDERLEEEDPALYETVTYIPEPERQLKDFKDLDAATLAKLAQYIYYGKPQVKLPAPTKTKEEDG